MTLLHVISYGDFMRPLISNLIYKGIISLASQAKLLPWK